MPTGLSAVEPVISSVPAVPVGGAVPAIGEVSVPSQGDLDIPLSELVPLSERPHVGEGDAPTVKKRQLLGELLRLLTRWCIKRLHHGFRLS